MMNRVEMNEEMMEAVVGGIAPTSSEEFSASFLTELVDTFLGKKKGESGSVIEIRGPKIPETIALVP